MPFSSDEDLIRRLPLPLAQLCRRAHNARTALERHQAAYYCWEAGLKLLGASAVLEYVRRGKHESRLTECLQSLARPSLGQWWEVVRELVPVLAENDNGPFGKSKTALFGPAAKDLPATAALDGALRELFKQGNASGPTVKLQDLFARLVRYRNDEVGHGSLGMRADDFYGRMADALQAALSELFDRLDVLAGGRLIFISDVSRDASGSWVIEQLELTGETPRRSPPLRLAHAGEDLPVPKQLYLQRPGKQAGQGVELSAAASGAPLLVSLHPLVIYDEGRRTVYFLNAQRRQQEVEYLDYVDGDRLARTDLAEFHRRLLERVVGAPLKTETLERWAARASQTEEAPTPQVAVAAEPTGGQTRGTPRVPRKEPGTASAESTGKSASGPTQAVRPASLRVALLYKRNVQPDEQLLHWLEKEFADRGAEVFIDRNMVVGVDWAKELERRLREADGVVLLLSEASVQSEMLAFEVQIVHDEALKRQGSPRLLPVRVNFEGHLPPELGGALDRIQYFLWTGAQDNGRLLSELLSALGSPPPPLKKIPPPAGAVPLESEFYVVRPTDADFQSALDRGDSVVLIRGARQMGKTSLLVRGLRQARAAGRRVVMADFQKLNEADFQSIDIFFRALGQWIADELDLPINPDDTWQAHRGASVNFERFLRRHVLEPLSVPLVLALDEVDRLFGRTFASEVFGLFRSWHNARVLDPLWGRLTLVIAYATEAHLFITDLNQSPFNVGTLVSLEDFTIEQVGWLNNRYGAPLAGEADLAAFHQLVGGHPYLVNRGLYQLAKQGLRAGDFADLAVRDDGLFGDHLRRMLVLLVRDAELCNVVRGMLGGQGCPSAESFYRLRSAGVLAGESAREARMRCDLYARYLERHLR